jgi:hypothetical protein
MRDGTVQWNQDDRPRRNVEAGACTRGSVNTSGRQAHHAALHTLIGQGQVAVQLAVESDFHSAAAVHDSALVAVHRLRLCNVLRTRTMNPADQKCQQMISHDQSSRTSLSTCFHRSLVRCTLHADPQVMDIYHEMPITSCAFPIRKLRGEKPPKTNEAYSQDSAYYAMQLKVISHIESLFRSGHRF